VDVQAHQTAGRLRRLTGMHPHSHPHALPAGPGMGLKTPLHLHHRRQAGPWRGKDGEEPVSLGRHFLAVATGQCRPDQPMMIGEYLRVGPFTHPP